MSNGTPGGYPPAGNNNRAPQGAAPAGNNRAFSADDLMGSFTNPAQIREKLRQASEHFNLVGSAVIATLPLGHEVAIQMVYLSMEKAAGDVYDVGMGKFGLSRPAVDKIASAAGAWTERTTCTAYGQRFCEYQVVVARKLLDGTVTYQTATRMIDLRAGSPTLEAMRAKARSSGKTGADVDKQVNEMLAMLPAHAETKARLRALRALLGLASYTAGQITKPFVIPSIAFTGRCPGNPAMELMFATGIMNSALGARNMMYGGGGAANALSPAPQAPPMLGYAQQAPALGMGGGAGAGGGGADLPDDDYDLNTGEVGGGQEPPPAPAQDWSAVRSAGDFEVGFGKDKGLKISKVRDLTWLRGILEKDLNTPEKSQFHGKCMSQLKAIDDERRRRGELPPEEAPPPAGAPPAATGNGAPPQGSAGAAPQGQRRAAAPPAQAPAGQAPDEYDGYPDRDI